MNTTEQQNTALLRDPAWKEYLAELARDTEKAGVPNVSRQCTQCGKPQHLGVLDGVRIWFGDSCIHAEQLTAKETGELSLYRSQVMHTRK